MKKSKTIPTKKQQQGNIFDAFVKDMFSRIFFFGDFLRHYANQEFVNNVFKGKEQDMLPTIFDELEARGEAKGLVRAILQVLTRRFRSPSASVEKKLFKIDLEQLSILLERAMYCESLKEFADSLK